MADASRVGKTRLENIIATLPKCLPDFPKIVLDEIPTALQMRPEDVLTLSEFNLLFEEKKEKPKIAAVDFKKKQRERQA